MPRLKRAWSDGTKAVVFTAHELLEKLSVLIPRPRVHQTRYHGVFAPNSKLRRHVTKEAVDRTVRGWIRASLFDEPTRAAAWLLERRRIEWAELMKRAWLVEVLVCDRCGGLRKVIATIHDRELGAMMLDAMKIVQDVPEVARARPPPAPAVWSEQVELDVTT